jgi:hypothetical protein
MFFFPAAEQQFFIAAILQVDVVSFNAAISACEPRQCPAS